MEKINIFVSNNQIFTPRYPVLVIKFTKTKIEPNENGENCIVNGYVTLNDIDGEDYSTSELVPISVSKFERLIKNDGRWIYEPISKVSKNAIDTFFVPESVWYTTENGGIVIDLVEYPLDDKYIIPPNDKTIDVINKYCDKIGRKFRKAYNWDKLAEETFKELEAILDK